jgi:C_GCAxxG_C_C family probable redox protein
VLLALAEQQGIRSDAIPRIATGFCGGISRTGNLCGAVSGGVMGISLAFGRNTPDESRDQVFATVQRFLAAFEARFGSLTCLGLTGCHLGTPDGQEKFRLNRDSIDCRGFVREATCIAAELIEAGKIRRADEPN